MGEVIDRKFEDWRKLIRIINDDVEKGKLFSRSLDVAVAVQQMLK